MTRLSLLAGPFAAALWVAAAVAAPTLEVTAGDVRTDAAGAFVNVAVRNPGPDSLDQVQVSCTFYAGRTSLGSSRTTIFSTPPGQTGRDQVRLLGATGANRAACVVTSPK